MNDIFSQLLNNGLIGNDGGDSDEENFNDIEEEAFNFEQPNHHDHSKANLLK